MTVQPFHDANRGFDLACEASTGPIADACDLIAEAISDTGSASDAMALRAHIDAMINSRLLGSAWLVWNRA